MKKTKKGAVSLYIVIFATLLLGVITLSFVRIMLKERSQSSNDDISQSAYDSALAGIEDAKLAIMKYNKCLSGSYIGSEDGSINDTNPDGSPTTVACEGSDGVIELMKNNNGNDCDIVSKILGRPTKPGEMDEKGEVQNQETTIQESNNVGSTTTDEQLDQAYTCVRISNSAGDFLGQLNQTNRSRVIPLRADQEFNKIVINWSSDSNYGSGDSKWTGKGALPLQNKNNPTYFPENWPTGVPPVIEAQLIQTSGTFKLTDFDMSDIDSSRMRTNRATAIVVPTQNGGTLNINKNQMAATSDKLGTDSDHTANGLFTTECFQDRRYHCSATIELPTPLGGGNRNNGEAFLRLANVYANGQAMDYQILLYNCEASCTPVAFSGVQAVIDSTGRTSDLLRRIESRIELVDVNFPYPEYSVELTGGSGEYALCKSFEITKNNWISGGVNNKGSDECTN